MKKRLFKMIILGGLCFMSFAKLFGQDSIMWNINRLLIWDDFKCIPNIYSKNKAETASICVLRYENGKQDRITRQYELKIYINAVFLTKESWAKSKSVELL